MDTQRLILFFVFSFSVFLLWQAWQKEAGGPQGITANGTPAVPTPTPVPQAKQADAKASQKAGPALPSPAIPAGEATAARHERIKVTTDTLVAEVDTLGGDIAYLELLGHKDSVGETHNMVLFGPGHRYFAQSGLTQAGLPNHRTLYASSQTAATLAEGQDKVEVVLSADDGNGLKVIKTLTFYRGQYQIDIRYDIDNGSGAPVATHAYFQLARDGETPAGASSMAKTYTGPAVYTPQDKFQKIAFGDIEKGKISYARTSDSGWVAMIQQYFVAAILPPDSASREIYTRKLGENYYSIGVILPVPSIAPGSKGTISVPMYAGPQEQWRLKAISPTLDLVVDYGWLTVIAAPLFWVLELFHGWVRNWGVAIILLTVSIKLLFFPLSAASYRSMARMKMVAPRLTKIRETYPDDRMKQNQAMMELYKTEKINPLGGCLPIAVQIPVFISLYWVLLAAVELRNAPFYGWIRDLSAADPWYVLPALMMASMVLQTRLNPTPPDPVQAKVMMIMPFAFGVMFFFFPAGLVLYWLVNNILSILQQWQITRMIETAKAASTKKR